MRRTSTVKTVEGKKDHILQVLKLHYALIKARRFVQGSILNTYFLILSKEASIRRLFLPLKVYLSRCDFDEFKNYEL